MLVTKIIRKGKKNVRVQFEGGEEMLVQVPSDGNFDSLIGKEVSELQRTEEVRPLIEKEFNCASCTVFYVKRGTLLVKEYDQTSYLKGRAATNLWTRIVTAGANLDASAIRDTALSLGLSVSIVRQSQVNVPEGYTCSVETDTPCVESHDLPYDTKRYSDL